MKKRHTQHVDRQQLWLLTTKAYHSINSLNLTGTAILSDWIYTWVITPMERLIMITLLCRGFHALEFYCCAMCIGNSNITIANKSVTPSYGGIAVKSFGSQNHTV